MCLVPYGPSPPPIPPNERAAKIADYFRVVIILHMGLALAMFLGTRYIDGVLDLLGAVVGYMSIRNPEGFNFQYILCYVTYCGFVFFYAIVRMILYFASSSSSDAPSSTWQLNIYVATLVAGPIIYIFGAVIGYHLYKELRAMMIPDGMGPFGDQQGGGGGYVPQEQASDSWRHAEIHPDGGVAAMSGGSSSSRSSAPTGFRAFTGQGHKLGGN